MLTTLSRSASRFSATSSLATWGQRRAGYNPPNFRKPLDPTLLQAGYCTVLCLTVS